jgi:hypothetical protein
MHQLSQATMGIPAVSMLTTYDNLCHYGFLSHHGILWWLADGREVQEHANQHVEVVQNKFLSTLLANTRHTCQQHPIFQVFFTCEAHEIK